MFEKEGEDSSVILVILEHFRSKTAMFCVGLFRLIASMRISTWYFGGIKHCHSGMIEHLDNLVLDIRCVFHSIRFVLHKVWVGMLCLSWSS